MAQHHLVALMIAMLLVAMTTCTPLHRTSGRMADDNSLRRESRILNSIPDNGDEDPGPVQDMADWDAFLENQLQRKMAERDYDWYDYYNDE